MSKYGIGNGLAFTKGSSSGPSGSTGSGSMRMAAYHDDYEDEMEEDEEEEEESQKDSTTTTLNQDTAWLNTKSTPNIEKYGIGAKLMMKMGYQEGQGLGLRNEGIVQPIETKLLPKGLGVGALRKDTVEDSMDVDSSEDEREKKSSIPSLFEVIQQLEAKGLGVPHKYKQLWDERIRHPESELIAAFEKLNGINLQWNELSAQEQFLTHQTTAAESNNSTSKTELDSAVLALELLELNQNNLQSVEGITSILTQITSDPLRQFSGAKALFVSVLNEPTQELFRAHFETSSNEKNPLIITLAEWSILYRELGESNDNQFLGPYDSLVYRLLAEHLQSFASSRSASDEHNNDILDILQTWLHSSVFLNPEAAIQIKLAREVIAPFLNEHLETWTPGKKFDFSPTIVVDYILCLSTEEAGIFTNSLETIKQKYLEFFEIEGWKNNNYLKDEITRLKSVWKAVFDQYLPGAFGAIINELTNSTIRYLTTWNGEISKLEALHAIFSANVLDPERVKLIFQFQIFNPWYSQFIELGSAKAAENFKSFYQFWTQSHEYPEYLVSLILWYLNSALYSMETGTHIHLPTLHGKTLPEAEEIVKFSGFSGQKARGNTQNVEGIPSYKLLTSFRDVVNAYCTSKGLLFTAANDFHPTLGHPLYKIQTKNSTKILAYLHEDVLWISKTVEGEFVPVSLEEIVHQLE